MTPSLLDHGGEELPNYPKVGKEVYLKGLHHFVGVLLQEGTVRSNPCIVNYQSDLPNFFA
jgi:hypothetical protein